MPQPITDTSNTPDYQKQLEAITKAAHNAGKLAKDFQEKGFERLEDKPGSPVPHLTEADLALDALIKEELMAAFPDYGWLSEETETDSTSLDNEFCWIVDPIDGTRGFVDGKSSFSVSIGLVHKGMPVAGGVCAPMDDVLITGAVGVGVFFNGEPAHTPDESLNNPPEILVSGTEVGEGLWEPFKDNFSLTPLGSIAYKLALIATGRADGVISLKPKNLHDVCAGHALLNVCGGKLIDLCGEDIPYGKTDHLLTGVVAGPSSSAVDAFFQHLRPCGSQT